MEKKRQLPNIRLRKVVLDDFRNINHAEIDIPEGRLQDYVNDEPSILGLYGQNGSGKTSLIMAISALKDALNGTPLIYATYSSCVRKGCSEAKLAFEFSAYDGNDNLYDLFYSFKLSVGDRKEDIKDKTVIVNQALDFVGIGKVLNNKGSERASDFFIGPKDKKISIFDEVVQYSTSFKGKKTNKQVLIDTSESVCKKTGKTFGNKVKYEQLTAKAEDGIDDALLKAKLESVIESKSFIFSDTTNELLLKSSESTLYKVILEGLKIYGENYLFVVMMNTSAANSMNVLPLSMWYDGGADGAYGFMFPITLFEHSSVHENLFPLVDYSIKKVSDVISTIVPSLKLEINKIGNTLSDSGENMVLFDLVSIRKDIRIPLSYESDGIKRIISILALLIAAYNHPSVTVVIDEIDSGIFEYMLGELLSIMNENAKGQLIFSSHNLRPLEVIPRKCLLFTTVNPDNRFAKLDGISGNNNLRDSYFRTISLGTGKDALYDSTDSFNIEQALFEAGQTMEN